MVNFANELNISTLLAIRLVVSDRYIDIGGMNFRPWRWRSSASQSMFWIMSVNIGNKGLVALTG